MKIKFWKMHGARNDFVLFDNRDGSFPGGDSAFIQHIAARNSGIGSEGVILIEKSETADFRMCFFNPDGGRANMCGNGARCAALLAYELGAVEKKMTIETAAGQLSAQIIPIGVRLRMTDPVDWKLEASLELNGRTMTYSFVNTGVPHVVMRTGSASSIDVQHVGANVRRHRDFGSQGTNVNFVEVLDPGNLTVRTYERGVEAETLSCGTGVTACGLIAAKNGWVHLPVKVHTRSGDVLVVDAKLTEEGAHDVTLTGPAAHVFEGILEYGVSNGH